VTLYDDPNRECVGLEPIWSGTGDNVPTASGATAGTPGTWTPPGTDAPASVAELQSSGITASPATLWTEGQYVQTTTSGAAGQAYWSGSAWTGGKAPAAG
jgi:hypothetical protein